RGAQVLERVSGELQGAGGAALEDGLRDLRRQDRRPDWDRIVAGWPAAVRDRLARFLAPTPYPFPFPGAVGTGPPIPLAAPAPLRAASGIHRLDLYVGGRNLGLLEQCGCRSRQAGGMARRATLLKRRLRGPTPALAFELGDAVPFDQDAFAPDRQKIAESDLALSLMAFAGESASVVSHAEVTYGSRFLAGRVARLPRGFALLSANVSATGLRIRRSLDLPALHPPVRIIGVEDPESYHLGRPLEFEDAVAPMTIEEPVAAIRKVLDGRGPGGLTVVAGALGPTAVLNIHAAFPDLPLILTDDYFRFTQDPRVRFDRPLEGKGFSTSGRLGKTLLVVLRTDAYALTRIGLAARDDGTIAGSELEDIVLDETIADDPRVRARLDAHYARLAAESGLAEPPPVGTRLRARLDAAYTGAAACAPCHAAETGQWETTPHASAYATLLSKRRQGVPGCFACHVTGYRQPTGYRVSSDVALRHVQCEACHGPGSKHVKDPRRDNIVGVPAAAVCTECHTEKHSGMTDLNFADYRAKITHAAGAGGH
ncbi:MAG TPA: multiheme c-type cytochrome, partial [Candidatus Dormibacteraeota bacterium]|nr:multiheme c-type cytochrome [Candidatus Dormibacteraeota bacterium]